MHESAYKVQVSVEKVLKAYRKQECLWNPKHSGYKNKNERQFAYKNMIKDLNAPDLTQNNIRLKIKSIRTSYRKELSLYLRRKSEGQHTAPKLVWFNQAHSFLKNVASIAKIARLNSNNDDNGTTIFEMNNSQQQQDDQFTEIIAEEYNYKEEDDDTQENPIQLEDDDSETNEYQNTINNQDDKNVVLTNSNNDDHTIEVEEYGLENNRHTNFKKLSPKNLNYSTNRKEANSQHCYCVSERDDEYQKFCNSVAAQLREIPDSYSRSMAKFKIQQILFEAETGQYMRNSIPATIALSNITPKNNMT